MSPKSLPHLVDDGPVLQATGLLHRVLEPQSPGPHPAVVMLHGRYGNEDVMWIFGDTVPSRWLKIAPRGLVEEGDGRYSWIHQEYGAWPPLPTFEPAISAVARFVESLPRVYNVDPQRTYLMGFSQGAAVSYGLAMQHPGLVQAIAGLVGFVPGECGRSPHIANLRDLPVFMAVGKKDRRVPYEQAQNCARTLQEAGADLELHEYDTGHKLNQQGLSDLRAWWLARS